MNEKLRIMIDEYFDGELDKKSEASLLVLLSQNDDVREYFKSMNVLQTTVSETMEGFPMELEERISRSVKEQRKTKLARTEEMRLFPKVSYAFAVLMLILSIYFFFKLETYQDRIENDFKPVNKTISYN